ncbi:MAG: chemotaxis protein CheW [Nitrospirota bacterium]
MNKLNQYLVFTLDEQRYALYLSAVERVVRIAELTPLPEAPDIVLGIINLQGRIIPVVNIRRRFNLPDREIEVSNQMIMSHTSKRVLALLVDVVEGIVERPEQEVILVEKILPDIEYVEGVVKLEDGLILIHDLERFLSLEEERKLEDAMKEGAVNQGAENG